MPKGIPVFHISGLQTKVKDLFRKYSRISITPKKLEWINDKLLERNHRKIWMPNVNQSVLRRGALCKVCKHSSLMNYERGRFICPKCGFKSKEVLMEGLHDYRLLFKPWLTTNEFREFFQIPSYKTAYKLLIRLEFQYEGANRGRIYFIPENMLDRPITS